MFNPERTWFVNPVDTPEALARKLTCQSWTLCTAFDLRGYLFLNDSTAEHRAPEFAVVRKPSRSGSPFVEVASIPLAECGPEQVLDLIRRAVAGAFDRADSVRVHSPHLETPQQHGTRPCGHCA